MLDAGKCSNPSGGESARVAWRVDEVKAVVDTHMRGQLECLEHEQTRRIVLNEEIRRLAIECEGAPRPDWPAVEVYLSAIQDANEKR